MIIAVVLDLDDTLCLTEAACFELENEALQRLRRPPMSRQIHRDSWGMPLLEGISLRSPGVDLHEFARVYQPLLEEAVASGRLDQVTPENCEALDALIEAGRRVMLLTSRTEAELRHLLGSEHVLAGRVSAFYHADNTTHLKPDPKAFDTLLSAERLSADECLYVGDSPGDARAATGAGLKFVACLESGIRTRADFAPYTVDAFIESFPDIVLAVANLDRAREGRAVQMPARGASPG